jgi:hypothetical protein
MGRPSKIGALPDALKRWLDRALTEQGFSGYAALEAQFAERGYTISKSALHRYGQKIERRFAAIKAATEAARLLTEGAADDQDARSEAVIALVQTEMFESILSLQDASAEDIDPAERMRLLSQAAKNIASLAGASVRLKKFQSEVRDKIARTLNALNAESLSGQGRAVDAETLRIVREEIYGIVG